MHVEADGLGFVKRVWLGLHRASVAQQQKLLSDPAERKPHEGRVYGVSKSTLEEILVPGIGYTPLVTDLADHVRELLDDRKAIEALVDRFEEVNKCLFGEELVIADGMVRELREVLSGKR
jgi:hypothetical protein